MVPFSFSGEEMALTGLRAVYWPREQALLVADLHLEKASFFAKAGQMLPPYDSRETLERLAVAIRRTGARRVIALGDNFHDDAGVARLEPHAAGMLAALTRAVDWVWITGNHDPALASGKNAAVGGVMVDELCIGDTILRHRAAPGESGSEISGHFHPKLTVRARGKRVTRPCAVMGSRTGGKARLILPAFGTLTGGMDARDPAIVSAMQPAHEIDALLPATGKLVQFPLWRAAA